MNANAFEFDVPVEAKGTSSVHDNFVADLMETQEKANDTTDSKSDKGFVSKGDKAGVNAITLSEGQVKNPDVSTESRMDGQKLYGDKGAGESSWISDKLADRLENILSGLDNVTKSQELPRQTEQSKEIYTQKAKAPVSEKERHMAKNDLEESIPEIVGAEVRKNLVSIQEALIDGDMAGLSKAFKSLGKDGKELPRYLKEINRQLEELGSDTELIRTKDGRVFVHDGSGDLAVQINPDGTNEVKAIERTKSGAIVVNPGEVLNRSVEDVGKKIGDSTTREINKVSPFILETKPQKLPDKGGFQHRIEPDKQEPEREFEPGCTKAVPMPQIEVPEGGIKAVPMPHIEVPEGGIKAVPMPHIEVPECSKPDKFPEKPGSGSGKGGMKVPADKLDKE